MQVDPSGYHHQQSLASARKLCKDYNIPVHGTVLELVQSMKQLHTAIEVR